MCGWIASLTCDVETGLRLLQHRGIRSKKMTVGDASVGHVRLPIVGLDEIWDQPVEIGGQVLMFAGEILNFRDHDSTAECDLPVVVDTWMSCGPGGFANFDGFWSICVASHDELHILCDYLAQKPTYYRTDIAAAASELDALAVLGPVTPDEIYFASVIKWGYCPETNRTPYREITKVLPGEYVVVIKGVREYGQIVDQLEPRSVDLKKEITDAVRRRVLASDVDVACLVSGGLDSSIVYTIAHQHGSVVPYFADSGDTEEQLRVSAVTSPIAVKKIYWNLVSAERAMHYMQEPIDLGSLVPQTALSDQVAERVCLTGDGADEVFGGYGRATRYDSQWSDIYHELVAWHLPRLDRVMMRNKVEVRSPFLSRRVVEGAMQLPWSMRRDKLYLRDLFREDLPPGIADAPKKPLRTSEIERDRESSTLAAVTMFKRAHWPRLQSDKIRIISS